MDFAPVQGDNLGELHLSVIIPAYNESQRLGRTLEATSRFLEDRGFAYEIITVDDGSADETTKFALAWSEAHPLTLGRLAPLRYEQNRGKGYAVKYGVLRSQGKFILVMDADLATPIEEIVKLEDALESGTVETKIAIGSRPLPASELLVRQPWYRELAGRGFNAVVQMAATPGIHDTQCGFKLMTRDCAHDLFSRAVLDGFSFDVEILFLARRLGYRIAEVPVRWSHQEGASAFPSPAAYLTQGIRMLLDLARIRWSHRRLRGKRVVAASFAAPPSSHA